MLELHDVSAVINIADATRINIEGSATVDSHDRVRLPSANRLIYQPRDMTAELLTMAEGKVIHHRGDEGVTLILIRVAIVQPEGGAGRGDEEACTRGAAASGLECAVGVIQRVRPGVGAGDEHIVSDSAV